MIDTDRDGDKDDVNYLINDELHAPQVYQCSQRYSEQIV